MSEQGLIGMTIAEWRENQQGKLTTRQQQTLTQQRWVWIAGTLAFVGLAALLLFVVVWKIVQPEFANRGQLVLGIPLGVFWLWLLRANFRRWRQVNQDLRERRVASLSGVVQVEMTFSPGLWQRVRYELFVRGRHFTITQATSRQLINQASYEIVYAPHSGLFLGAHLITSESPAPQSLRSVPPSLLDPLTTQELDILRCIAAGFSNKEIAQELHFAVNSIKMYNSQIYRKLGVQRRTEAVARGRELGLL